AMQLRASIERNGGTVRVRHIVEILDEAYGGAQTKRSLVGADAAHRNGHVRHERAGAAR
ncbi:MAG: hypothetical protein IT337_11320, partial [Thermomicrobiales bacterium]|nr:hypothetical protein [Thermomicrobiales bacterium]